MLFNDNKSEPVIKMGVDEFLFSRSGYAQNIP